MRFLCLLLTILITVSIVHANSCLQFDVTFGYPGAYDRYNPMNLKIGYIGTPNAYLNLRNMSDETMTVYIHRMVDAGNGNGVIDFEWANNPYFYDPIILGPSELISNTYLGWFRIAPIYEYANYRMQGLWVQGHFYAETETGCRSEDVPYKVIITPELSTWALLACSGLAGMMLRRRRKA